MIRNVSVLSDARDTDDGKNMAEIVICPARFLLENSNSCTHLTKFLTGFLQYACDLQNTADKRSVGVTSEPLDERYH